MILTSNALAPDGRQLLRGQTLPDGLPAEFVRDIDEFLVADDAHPLLRLTVADDEAAEKAWRRVHDEVPADDPLAGTIADRIRHLAADVGAHRVARLRPYRDRLPDSGDGDVALDGRAARHRRGRS